MNRKLTAVEWLYNELQYHIKVDWPMNKSIRNKFEKAKEIEKNQIIEAQLYARNASNLLNNNATKSTYIRWAEKYYNENYES